MKIPQIYYYNYRTKNYNISIDKLLIKNSKLFVKDTAVVKDTVSSTIQKLNIALFNIKYKVIKGVKIQGTGRLTRRLTALRSISKFKQKGSLKNIYSSYSNFSTIILTGHIKSNIQYIKKNYNNRNGSFGIKTQISSY